MAGRRPAGGGLLQTFRVMLIMLVCLSSGLTAVYAGASLAVVAGATAVGLVVGVVVVAIALPGSAADGEPDSRLQWDD